MTKTLSAWRKNYPRNSSAHYPLSIYRSFASSTSSKTSYFFLCVVAYYCQVLRHINSGPASTTRDTVCKSYKFALSHIGQDKDSREIWQDYIQFLRVGEAHTTWEEQQKMDALCKVYHHAIQIPLDNVEALWQELETFETGLNQITAKKFMADLSPAHMQVLTMLRQLTNHLVTLFPLPQVHIRFTALKPMLIQLSAFQVNLWTGWNEIFVPSMHPREHSLESGRHIWNGRRATLWRSRTRTNQSWLRGYRMFTRRQSSGWGTILRYGTSTHLSPKIKTDCCETTGS